MGSPKPALIAPQKKGGVFCAAFCVTGLIVAEQPAEQTALIAGIRIEKTADRVFNTAEKAALTIGVEDSTHGVINDP
jgi:hypothetical protein